MPKNICIVGADEHNHRILADLPEVEQFRSGPGRCHFRNP